MKRGRATAETAHLQVFEGLVGAHAALGSAVDVRPMPPPLRQVCQLARQLQQYDIMTRYQRFSCAEQ